MNWRSPIPLSIAGLVVVLLGVGSAYVVRTFWPTSSPTPTAPTIEAKPQPIILRDKNAPTPTTITSLPPQPDANLFKNPNEPAYISGKGFTPDAQRVLDITSLQISVEKYRVAKGRYPTTLADLFLDFAPKDENDRPLSVPPVDPVTNQPYAYTVAGDGASYQISATLSAGKAYTVSGQTR